MCVCVCACTLNMSINESTKYEIDIIQSFVINVNMIKQTNTWTHTHTYIYIYIYIERERFNCKTYSAANICIVVKKETKITKCRVVSFMTFNMDVDKTIRHVMKTTTVWMEQTKLDQIIDYDVANDNPMSNIIILSLTSVCAFGNAFKRKSNNLSNNNWNIHNRTRWK